MSVGKRRQAQRESFPAPPSSVSFFFICSLGEGEGGQGHTETIRNGRKTKGSLMKRLPIFVSSSSVIVAQAGCLRGGGHGEARLWAKRVKTPCLLHVRNRFSVAVREGGSSWVSEEAPRPGGAQATGKATEQQLPLLEQERWSRGFV